jgi:secreted PhoX family phosphatase
VHGIAGDFRVTEFAGPCFSPDGKWLFVNAQKAGVTLAITGPWERGAA